MWSRRKTRHRMVMWQAQVFVLSEGHNMLEDFWEENHLNRSRKSPVAAAGSEVEVCSQKQSTGKYHRSLGMLTLSLSTRPTHQNQI